jgi:hypothetical protein
MQHRICDEIMKGKEKSLVTIHQGNGGRFRGSHSVNQLHGGVNGGRNIGCCNVRRIIRPDQDEIGWGVGTGDQIDFLGVKRDK